MDRSDLREVLRRANASPHGLLLKVSEPKRLRQLFYVLRKEEALPMLEFRIVESLEGNVQIERRHNGASR
jgi:hypothetical protein